MYIWFRYVLSRDIFDEGTKVCVWGWLLLICHRSDTYVSELHIFGEMSILNKAKVIIRYHEHDFLRTTLWGMNTKGSIVKDCQDTIILGLL